MTQMTKKLNPAVGMFLIGIMLTIAFFLAINSAHTVPDSKARLPRSAEEMTAFATMLNNVQQGDLLVVVPPIGGDEPPGLFTIDTVRMDAAGEASESFMIEPVLPVGQITEEYVSVKDLIDEHRDKETVYIIPKKNANLFYNNIGGVAFPLARR